MKKLFSFILCVAMIISFNAVYVSATDTSGMSIDVSVTTKVVEDGVVYTYRPYTIKAVYDSGATEHDLFLKKSWIRVDLLDANANPTDAYLQNKDREHLINDIGHYYATIGTCEASFEIDVTLNGTYLFCGWSGRTETPDFIERVDISDIEVERPMIDFELTMSGDFSQDVIGTAQITNLDSGSTETIKRYVFLKGYLLPPGAWPESLPPEWCNLMYDEKVGRNLEDFIAEGLVIEATADGVYELKDPGMYMLFAEDSSGHYSYISDTTPGFDEYEDYYNRFEIEVEMVEGTVDNIIQYVVRVTSENEIARLDYVVLSEHDIEASQNGTDEYYLEKEKHTIEDGEIAISSSESIIICAVDNTGNAAFKRLEATTIPTPEPDYVYEITSLTLTDMSGTEITAPSAGQSFEAEATVSKTAERDGKDYIFVAVYDKAGALLSLDYVKANLAVGEYSFGFNIPAQSAEIGSIKAFVWSSFTSTEPLAEAKTLTFPLTNE